jgi:hypothetical protein
VLTARTEVIDRMLMSANDTCARSWPRTRRTTTDDDPIAAASFALPGPITPWPTCPSSRSDVGPSLAASSTNTCGSPKSPAQDQRQSFEPHRVRRQGLEPRTRGLREAAALSATPCPRWVVVRLGGHYSRLIGELAVADIWPATGADGSLWRAWGCSPGTWPGCGGAEFRRLPRSRSGDSQRASPQRWRTGPRRSRPEERRTRWGRPAPDTPPVAARLLARAAPQRRRR